MASSNVVISSAVCVSVHACMLFTDQHALKLCSGILHSRPT